MEASVLRLEQRVQTGHEISATVIPTCRDQRDCLMRQYKLLRRGHLHERSKVHEILRAIHVIPRQYLQGDQVPRSRNGHRQPSEESHRLRSNDDLRFDAGRGEKKVDNGRGRP